jgi:hypothetical protein
VVEEKEIEECCSKRTVLKIIIQSYHSMAESTSSSVVDKTPVTTPQNKVHTTPRPGEAAIKQQ